MVAVVTGKTPEWLVPDPVSIGQEFVFLMLMNLYVPVGHLSRPAPTAA